jgi:hypothetical protein
MAPLNIVNLKDASAASPIKMLVFGSSGIGKTSLAKTTGEPTLVISAEAGLLSIAGADVDVFDISKDSSGALLEKDKRIARLGEVYKHLLTAEAQNRWKWIIVDSITEISQNMVEKLQVEFPDAKDTLRLYGENAKLMRALIKSFRDLPHYNVVFTALSEDDKDESNKRYIGISMVGKMSQQIAGYLDEVLFYFIRKDDAGNETRLLLTQPVEGIIAKDRSGKLSKFEEPNLAAIAKKITVSKKGE